MNQVSTLDGSFGFDAIAADDLDLSGFLNESSELFDPPKPDFSTAITSLTDPSCAVLDLAADLEMKKKEKNREAARKYRSKSRQMALSVEEKCDQLSHQNAEMRARITQLKREKEFLQLLLAKGA